MNVYTERFISIPGATLFYYTAGSGPVPLLVFHGFGQTHKAFDPWIGALEQKYTLILVDLFFHGRSSWEDVDTPLRKDAWKRMIKLIMEQEKVTSFSLAGYSLGGKFALATLEAWPNAVKEVYLIAPDGITPNFWYSLATGSGPLRKLFHSMIRNERRFTTLTSIARQFRVTDKGIIRFAETQMDTSAKRERVHNTWVAFRHLKFNLRDLSELLHRFSIPAAVIAGKYDRIVPPERLAAALNRLKKARLHVVASGHNDLIAAALPFLIK